MPKNSLSKQSKGVSPRSSRKLQGGEALRPVRSNRGLEIAYQRKLEKLLTSLHKSVTYWVKAEYRKHPPAILAMDASPVEWMVRLIHQLKKRWLQQIEETAPKLAEYFSKAVADRTDAALKKILRDGGFSVRFQLTPAMRDIRAASITENVSLIRSIPARYFDEIEGIVARGYSQGYDLKMVTDELQKRFEISRKRAAFISRDQASKLNSQLSRARYQEAGIKTAIWTHSRGGKVPRETHLHVMNGQEFDLAEGLFDPDPRVNKMVHPGELINCRCVAKPVVRGFS